MQSWAGGSVSDAGKCCLFKNCYEKGTERVYTFQFGTCLKLVSDLSVQTGLQSSYLNICCHQQDPNQAFIMLIWNFGMATSRHKAAQTTATHYSGSMRLNQSSQPVASSPPQKRGTPRPPHTTPHSATPSAPQDPTPGSKCLPTYNW